MILNNALVNLTEIASVLPPNIVRGMETLITILKAAGILFIIYFAFLITNGVINWKSSRRLKYIEEKTRIIEEKLDLLLKRRKNKKA